MRVRLEEAWKLQDGSILSPHWNEWFDASKDNLVDIEEVIDGISHLGQWYEVGGDNLPDAWQALEDVYWHDPEEDHSCMIEITKIDRDAGRLTGKNAAGEEIKCLIIECESPLLVRRMAEIYSPPKVITSMNEVDVFGTWENEDGPEGWYAITTEDGIVAYAKDEALAFQIRDMIIKERREAVKGYLSERFSA
jgi:hypothetical protein